MKDFRIAKGSIIETNSSREDRNTFGFRFMFREMSDLLNFPIYDACCPTNFTPVRYNGNTEVLEVFDPQLKAWVPAPSSGGGGLESVVAGTNVTVDNTDPLNPIVNAPTPSFGATTAVGNSSAVDIIVNGVNAGIGAGSVATNTRFGNSALAANTTGSLNTAFGWHALLSATTASQNTAVGYESMALITTGSFNTAFGRWSLTSATTAFQNVAIGLNAMRFMQTGSLNVALGTTAMSATTSGTVNTALGHRTLELMTSGDFNTAVGSQAGVNFLSGQQNTFIGRSSGGGITTGSYNTIIGATVGGFSPADSNLVVIGDGQGNRRIEFSSTGKGKLNNYGTGIQTGTPAYAIGVDASGNLIERPILKVTDDYANDAAAATGGIAVGQLYHTSGVVKIRLV